MSEKEPNVQKTIDEYRRRRETAWRGPVLLIVAAILLIGGAAALIYWLTGENTPLAKPTETPTATFTSTATTVPPTPTSTPTVTPTEAPSPTPTATPTIPGPFIYEVLEGDSCWTIAVKFKVDLLLLIQINNLDPTCPIKIGDKLTIPGTETQLPTSTPLPTNLRSGQIIDYVVQLGDSLGAIALKFNTTIEAIKEENDVQNENEITAGLILKIPVNLVPTDTPAPPTFTPAPTSVTPMPTATSTRAP